MGSRDHQAYEPKALGEKTPTPSFMRCPSGQDLLIGKMKGSSLRCSPLRARAALFIAASLLLAGAHRTARRPEFGRTLPANECRPGTMYSMGGTDLRQMLHRNCTRLASHSSVRPHMSSQWG